MQVVRNGLLPGGVCLRDGQPDPVRRAAHPTRPLAPVVSAQRRVLRFGKLDRGINARNFCFQRPARLRRVYRLHRVLDGGLQAEACHGAADEMHDVRASFAAFSFSNSVYHRSVSLSNELRRREI